MNLLFISPSYKPAYIYGGPIVVIAMLAENLVTSGHQVTIYTTTANGAKELEVEAGKEIWIEGVKVIYFTRNTGDHTHASIDLWRFLSKTVLDFDAVHIHSWWNFLVLGAARICKSKGVVPVLSPHGMFSNYILETNNSAKKKWIHRLAGKKLLQHTKLHVSTEMEWNESQRIIPGWEGDIIPNLVALSDHAYAKSENEIFIIGFLSRVDPKKGLDILITALSKVSFPYRLLIAGSGEKEYEQSLRALSAKLGTEALIEWVGWKNGEEKFEFLSRLDLFALTSHSENFAIVVIESLSIGTPVFISNQVGLYQYVLHNNLGWITTTDAMQVTQDLETIYREKAQLKRISEQSPPLIEKHFDRQFLTQQYIKLYEK